MSQLMPWMLGLAVVVAVAIVARAVVSLMTVFRVTPSRPVTAVAAIDASAGNEQGDGANRKEDKFHTPNAPTE